MNKPILLIVVAVLLIVLLAYFQLNQSSEPQGFEEGLNQTEISSNQELEDGVQDITIDEVDIADASNDLGVYIITSTGEKRKIAESDNPQTIENYFDIKTYHKAYLSPDNKFVALEGSIFEDGFVAVYEVQTDTLHDQQWGYVDAWTNEGLLKVDACDLSGEECIYLISRDSAKPWELIDRAVSQ